MTRTLELRARVTALSSIHHGGGQSIGINAKLRREKFMQPDGAVEEVPVISGNGLRGLLRDRGMLHMCRALGYGVNEATGGVQGLSLAAYYFLFSGGALTQDAGKALSIDRARDLRRLIPLAGIFGGAVGNMILPGRINVDKMIPICAETSHLLPDIYRLPAAPSVWDITQEEMYTRKDDEKNEHLRVLLAPPTRALLEDEAALRRAQPANAPVEETGAKQQMMYYVETLCAGAQLAWSITLDDVTDTELEAFAVTLVEFSKAPYIGAKSSVGLGKIALDILDFMVIDNRVQAHGAAVAVPAGEAYYRHLRDHGGDMRAILGEFQ